MIEPDADPWPYGTAYDSVLDGARRGLDGLFPTIHEQPHTDDAPKEAEPPEPPEGEDIGEP